VWGTAIASGGSGLAVGAMLGGAAHPVVFLGFTLSLAGTLMLLWNTRRA
jgi:hypothetical protein